MIIRAALESDADVLSALDRATWSPDVSPAPPPARDRPFFQGRRTPDAVWVAEVGGRPVGYVQVEPGHDIPSHAHVAFVCGLAVDPAHQGQGIGRRLLRTALEALERRGVRKVRSNVLASNPASLAAHRAVGFVVEGTLRGEFLREVGPVDNVLLACWTRPFHSGSAS